MTLTTESKLVQCSSTALHVWQQEFNSNHHVRLFFWTSFCFQFGLDDSQFNIFFCVCFVWLLFCLAIVQMIVNETYLCCRCLDIFWFCFVFSLVWRIVDETYFWCSYCQTHNQFGQQLCTGLTCHSIACKCHTGFYQK